MPIVHWVSIFRGHKMPGKTQNRTNLPGKSCKIILAALKQRRNTTCDLVVKSQVKIGKKNEARSKNWKCEKF